MRVQVTGVPIIEWMDWIELLLESSRICALVNTLVVACHDEDFEENMVCTYRYIGMYEECMHAPLSLCIISSVMTNPPLSPEIFKKHAVASSNYANQDFNQVAHLALMEGCHGNSECLKHELV